METEILATNAIKEVIAQTEYLCPYINEGDKEPSWDGYIYAYKNSKKSKSDMVGRVPVQVKGRSNKKLKASTISFSIKAEDLINYRNDGGVLYFVVHIDKEYNKKIYYTRLLPYVINNTLNRTQQGRTPKVLLKELPEGKDEITNIVFDFIRDSKRQDIVKNGQNWDIDMITKLFGEKLEYEFTFSSLGVDKNDPFSYLKDHDVFTYAHNADKSLYIPLHHIDHMDAMMFENSVSVCVNGKEYYNTVQIEKRNDDRTIIKFGKSFEIQLNEKNQKFVYHLNGNLNEQSTALEFILDLRKTMAISFDGVELTMAPTKKELESFDMEAIKDKLHFFGLIKQVLDKLRIKTPLEIDKVSERQEDYLKLLINAFLYNKNVCYKKGENIAPVATLDIGNLKIALIFRTKDGQEYIVEDFFSQHIDCRIDSSEKQETSQFCILKAADYNELSNISTDYIQEDFKKYENEAHYVKTQFAVLEMIRAYDENSNNIEILDVAESLSHWLYRKDSDNICHRLNELQCIARKRELSDLEMNELFDMSKDDSLSSVIKIGIMILQGNSNYANRLIENLEEKDRTEFLTMPILKLLKSNT